MRKAVLLSVAVILLAGCSAEEAKEAVVKSATPVETVKLAGKTAADAGVAMSYEGHSVRVGDSWEEAQKVFPERRLAYGLRSLPERFGSDFSAHGWETNEGQGYGVITYKDLVVAAVYHTEDVENDYAESLFEAQRAGTGALPMQQVVTGTLTWNFWQGNSGTQRLMVLRDKGKKGTDVTILMGDANVLDALGATKPVAPNPSVAPFISSPPPKGAADLPTDGTKLGPRA